MPQDCVNDKKQTIVVSKFLSYPHIESRQETNDLKNIEGNKVTDNRKVKKVLASLYCGSLRGYKQKYQLQSI